MSNTPVKDPEFSLFNYGDEVQQRIGAYDQLEKEAEVLYHQMPLYLQDAFFELVYYPVKGASNMNKKVLYAYKSRVYAEQKRNSANKYADKALAAFESIKRETEKFNTSIAEGKWNKMMSFHPRDLPVFDMPEVGHYQPIQEKEAGIMPEGYSEPILSAPGLSALPGFNSLTRKEYFVDIFNSGKQALNWEATCNQTWVKLSQTSGLLDTRIRLWVSVDWDQLPKKDSLHAFVTIRINNQNYRVNIQVSNQLLKTQHKTAFVEDNGVIVMEAENFSSLNHTEVASWQKIAGLGRNGDAMGTYPITIPPFSEKEESKAPVLEYEFYSTFQGEAKVLFYCLPNQPISAEYQLRFGVNVDDKQPVVVNGMLKNELDERNPEWQNNVLNSVSVQSCKINLNKSGRHILKVKMIDPGVVLDKIVINMNGLKLSYGGPGQTECLKSGFGGN